MKTTKDIIGLIVHEEFVKARKNIETALDKKLAVQINEIFPALVPLAGMAGKALLGGAAAAAGSGIANKIMGSANNPVQGEDKPCQGEDCMGEDEEEKDEKDKDEEEDEGDEGEEDEGEEEGEEEDEGEEDEGEEDEGEEDEGEEDDAEDAATKNRQSMIANRSKDKEEMNEALKGKQKKLDVAPPFGKLTGADFAKLRGRKGK